MGNTLTLESPSGEASKLVGIFAVVHDEGVLSSVNGTTSSFIRRQENVNFAGTWNITSVDSSNSCFPNSTVKITQSEGNVTASWRWENSEACQFLGLAETNFTQTQPTPKGKALFIDIIVKALPRSAGIFVVEGEKAKLIVTDGGAAEFIKKQDDQPKFPWGWVIAGIAVIVVIVVGGFCFVQKKKKKEIEQDYRSADSALMA